jgi:hypothetical protein
MITQYVGMCLPLLKCSPAISRTQYEQMDALLSTLVAALRILKVRAMLTLVNVFHTLNKKERSNSVDEYFLNWNTGTWRENDTKLTISASHATADNTTGYVCAHGLQCDEG